MASYKNNFNYYSINIVRYLMLRVAMLFFIVMPCGAYAEDNSVVLVASNESTINNVTILDIRRIYLGITPEDTTQINKPVLNMADKALYDNFVKNVMHMTEEGYRRKMVKRVFLRGNDYVHEVFSNKELIEYLNNNKNDISFIKKSDIKETDNIKIIAVLW